jgi:hypothetical protein
MGKRYAKDDQWRKSIPGPGKCNYLNYLDEAVNTLN